MELLQGDLKLNDIRKATEEMLTYVDNLSGKDMERDRYKHIA